MDTRKAWRIGPAAAEIGVAPQTLDSAVRRGDLPHSLLGCGMIVVSIDDAKKWAKTPRKRGPKPAKR